MPSCYTRSNLVITWNSFPTGSCDEELYQRWVGFCAAVPAHDMSPLMRLYSVAISFSLYTSIPTELGLEALEYWIKRLRNQIPSRFTMEFILQKAEFVLENNYCIFDSKMFWQLIGTFCSSLCVFGNRVPRGDQIVSRITSSTFWSRRVLENYWTLFQIHGRRNNIVSSRCRSKFIPSIVE